MTQTRNQSSRTATMSCTPMDLPIRRDADEGAITLPGCNA